MGIISCHDTYWTEHVLERFQKVASNKGEREKVVQITAFPKFLVDCEILL